MGTAKVKIVMNVEVEDFEGFMQKLENALIKFSKESKSNITKVEVKEK